MGNIRFLPESVSTGHDWNVRSCGIADLHMKVGERQVLDEFCRSSANNMAPQFVQVNV